MDLNLDEIAMMNDLNASSISATLQRMTGIIAVVQYTINITHLFISIYFTYGIYSTSLIHKNLKLLVITIATQYSFIAVGRIGETLNSTTFADKPIIVTNALCLVFKVINDAALITSCTSILLIGMERLLATVKKQSYANQGAGVGIAMLAITIGIGTLFSLSTLIYDMFAASTFDIFTTRTSCQNLFMHPIALPLCWCFGGVTFIIGTLMLLVLYRYNVYMRYKCLHESLTIRYQYNENIATLKVLVPAVAGYGVMIFLGVTISIYAFVVLMRSNQNSFDVQIAFQFLYMIADLYGLYFIAYIFLKFRPMNKRLRKHLRWICALPMSAANAINPFTAADPKYVSDFYFKQLADVWNMPKTSDTARKPEGKLEKAIYFKNQLSQASDSYSEAHKSRLFVPQ